jgi:GT2 family glycosyltransferase/nucleoside-diphosphate-sugar epimerase
MVNAAHTSVVMVTYQTDAGLRVSVDSVLRQDGLRELIIVDNGNAESVLQWLRELAENNKQVKLLTGHGNVGFARGCNLGAAEATADYLLLLNPDAILPENALVTMASAMQAREDAWLMGAHLLNADGTEQRGGRRKVMTPCNALSESLYLYRLLGWERLNDHKTPVPTEVTKLEAISGAFMFFRRSKYQQLSGMDEQYFLHVEDLDICRRVNEEGGVIYFVPEVKVVHLRSTSKASSVFVEWQKAVSGYLYFRKFYGAAIWVPMAAAMALRFAGKLAVGAVLRILPEKEDRKAVRRLLLLYDYVLNGKADEQPYEGKTMLVSGATSQIGICTVGRLLAGGANVLALKHEKEVYFTHPRLTWVKADLKAGEIDLQGKQVETVIHTAPLWMLPDVLSTLIAARVKRIVAFGSTSVFTKIYSANKSEKDIVQRLEEAELQISDRCRKSGVNFTILRPTMVYGVGLDENVTQIAEFAQRYHFFPIYPPAKGRRQPVHADDLAQMAIKILDNAKTHNKSYNIGGGEVLTYLAMVERIFFALDQTPRIVKVKDLPRVMDVVGKYLLSGRMNGEMARRMNEDLLFLESDSRRDFVFKPRAFLRDGRRDLGQF